MALMYRVRTEFSGLTGAPYLSTMYFEAAASSAAAASERVAAWWNDVNALSYTDLLWNVLPDVDVVESTTGQIVGVDAGTPDSGTGGASGEALPYATQALVRWRTGEYVGGREIRGRTFIPGIAELYSVQGQLSGSAETIINDAAQVLLTPTGPNLIIYSRARLQFANVTSASVWNQFAVLRSRRD